MKSILRSFALLIALLACASLSALALQESQPSPQKGSAAASPDAARPAEPANPGQEVTHASNEAAGRTGQEAEAGHHAEGESEAHDEEAAFKYSASVRYIAKKTGLSLTAVYWVSVILNFAIIAVFVVFFMKSKVPTLLRNRTQEIQKGMEEARLASEDAGRRLRDVEARLARLSSDIQDMQKQAESDARAEEERLRSSIDDEKQKILQAAEQEITQTANAVRRDLQKYAAELAVSFAEKGIRVDTNSDKALVEDFTEQLAADTRRNGNS